MVFSPLRLNLRLIRYIYKVYILVVVTSVTKSLYLLFASKGLTFRPNWSYGIQSVSNLLNLRLIHGRCRVLWHVEYTLKMLSSKPLGLS